MKLKLTNEPCELVAWERFNMALGWIMIAKIKLADGSLFWVERNELIIDN